MTDRLDHVLTTDQAGRPVACVCGHQGDLLAHARNVLPIIDVKGTPRTPVQPRSD